MEGERSFDPYAAGSAERYAAMARIRAGDRVVETAAGHYVATAAGVTAGLRDVEKFVGSFIDTSALHEDDVMISAIPEPRHGRIRRVINSVIAPHRTADVEPFARALAGRLVDGALATAAEQGFVDLVTEVVDPLPSTVIAQVCGVPTEDQGRFQQWSDELLARQNAGTSGALVDVHAEFGAYIEEQVERRRAMADPPDDVITRFIATDVDGEFLSVRAICTQVMFLIVAGNETTRNLIANCLHTLAGDAALYELVRTTPALVPVVIEESLRHDSPVQVLARAVLADTELDGCPVHMGERVVFGVASANRDERIHDRPDEFRVDRPKPRDHLAFGTGPHVCPGATLARMEATVLLEELASRVRAFALADGFRPAPDPVFWALGHRSLPVMVTPA